MRPSKPLHCREKSIKTPLFYLIVLLALVLSACAGPVKARDQVTSDPATTIPPTQTPLPAAMPTDTPMDPTATASPTQTAPPTATATKALGIGSSRVSEIDGMEQIYIPAGEFKLGAEVSDKDAKRTIEGGRAYPELPQQTLYLDSFWIDKFEVTNRQYQLCVDAGGCEPPYVNYLEKRVHYYDNPEFANFPVVYVNWFMAGQYCTWAGRRLPTEAEWEKAARGTDGRKYPWGNDPITNDKASFCDINCTSRPRHNDSFNDGWDLTAPVGSFPAGASPYGVMDMAGNVWEWTSTIIRDYPYDPKDGREDPSAPGERVWRGGAWTNGYWWMRTSLRYRSIPSYWNVNIGIRCASTK